jgi:hypothetical protein
MKLAYPCPCIIYQCQVQCGNGMIDAPRSLDFSPQSGLIEIPRVLLLQVHDWQTGDR